MVKAVELLADTLNVIKGQKSNKISSIVKYLTSLVAVVAISSCSSSGDSIDKLFGNTTPILTTQSSKTVAQTDLIKIDVNNVKDGEPGTDEDMRYTCHYDRTPDGNVLQVAPCSSIPNSVVTFNGNTGELEWTPAQHNDNLGEYEIKIVGTNESGESNQIFNIGVRLKFNGVNLVQNITGISADLSWTPNANAVAYQIYKLNYLTGLYELHQTESNGASTGVTMAGLLPNKVHSVRVYAIDSLGYPDGNAVSSTFITTSLVKLGMAVNTTTAPAGTPINFTINALNADDSPQTIGGLAMSANISSGTTSGNFSVITDNHDGSYSFTFTPTTVGTNPTIVVSTTTTTYFLINSILLNAGPGPATSANSSISSTSNTITSGNSVTVTGTVRDQYNNPISSGPTITFGASGGTSTGSFSAVTNVGNGVYTATYTGVLAGTAKNISILVNGVALPSLSTPVAVTPGLVSNATSSIAVSIASLPSGTDSVVTATLKDANGNFIPSGILVAFNKAGGSSTGIYGSVTNNGNGTYSTTYTGVLAGSAQTLSVTVDSLLLTPTASIAVIPGAPHAGNSNLSLSAATVVSGTFITATATIKDVNNNPIDSGIAVTFTKTGGTSTGTFNAVTNQGSGQYTVRYTGVVSGTAQNIQIQIGGVNFDAAEALTVLNAAPSSANSTITTNLSSIPSGGTATITATLKDLNNNFVASGYAISFSKSGGTSTGTFGSITNNADGTYTTTYDGLVAGSPQTISVLVDGFILGPTVNQTVTVGAPFAANSTFSLSAATVVSGLAVTGTAVIRDVNNNPISSGITVTLVKSGGTSTGTLSAVSNNGSGNYTATYSGIVAGTAQSIQLQIGGTNFLSAQSIQVLNAAPFATNSLISTTAATVVSGASATITATVRDLNNNPIISGYTVSFSKSGGTSTGIFGAVTNNGNGTYTTTYDGVVAGSAQTIALLIDGSALGPNLTETVVVGAPFAANSSFGLSASTVVSGLSVTGTAIIKDVNNNPISSGITVTFVKSGGTSTGTLSAIANNGSGNYSGTYTGVVSGTAQTVQLQIGGTNFLSAQSISVLNAAPSAANSLISTTAATIVSGTSATITATVRDLNNNPIISGYTVSFSKSGGTSTGNFGAVTNNGDGTYSVTYSGVVAGSAQTIALLIDGTGLGPNLTETVTVGAPNNILSTLTVSSNTIVAGSTSTLTATIKDANGNPISTGIIVSFDKAGGTSTGTYSAVTNVGSGVYTAVYTGHVAGTAQTVQANVNLAGFGPTQSIQVIVGVPTLANSSLTLSANTIASSSVVNINAVIRDSENNPITNQYAITFDAIGGSSTGNLTATNNAGSGSFTTTYTGVVAGTAQTVRVFYDGIQISGFGSNTIRVVPGPVSVANSVFTIAGSASAVVQSTSAAALALNIRDANFNAISSTDTTITFNKTAAVSNGTISAITNNGGGNYSGTYTGTTTGAAQTINLIVNGTTVGMSVTATVTAGPPTKIVMTAAPVGTLNSIDCNGPYTMTLNDANNNVTVSVGAVTVSLSSAPALSHTGTIFTDAACTVGATALTIPSSTSTLSFYYKSYTPQNITLTLSPNLSIASTTQNLVNVPVVSWIGSSAYFTMNGSGSQTVYDDSSGGMYSPQDVLIYGNFMYVADNTTHRIIKYDITTNQMIGWIGHVGSTEGITAYDSGTGCNSLAIGALTPVWCLGGRSNSYTAATLNAPRNLATDGTYLYVASGSRILRFQLSDGAYRGWYGRIATTTGMTDNGSSGTVCSGAGATATTPLWCYGGTNNASGTTNGQFNTVAAMVYLSGYLYVTDYSNHRIQRIDVSGANPAFAGWSGNIASIAGMTDNGVTGTVCSTAGVGGATPQWCYGGTSQSANRYQLQLTPTETAAPNEGYRNPLAIATDGTYLYIGDENNFRIVRVNLSTGVFGGWIGPVRLSTATNPTTPTYAANQYTTTWTTGGVVSGNSNGVTGYNRVNALYVDTSVTPNILYIVDRDAYRVAQVRTTDGQGYKWIGRNSASPTGGSPGCSSTPANGTNPGWCTGGTAGRYGNTNGTFYNPNGIAFTASKFYVADTINARIQRFDKATGIFEGWVGTGSVPSTTWSRSLAGGTIAARAGFDDYSLTENSGGTWYLGLTGDSNGNLFQTDGWHRIKKFTKLNGAISGYVGVISGFGPTAPIDCAGYTSGFTPTWCTGGGRTSSGAGVHGYNNPFSIAVDSTYAYVANYSNGRIDRVKTSDGTYMGWIGYVATSPTDGESTCNGRAAGTYTPGWCIGGTAGSVATNLGFTNPRAMYVDGSSLFTSDGSGRLMRLGTTSGDFTGVTGGVSSADPSCTVAGNVANRWCTVAAVGVSTNNYGGINAASAIAGNTNYLFVADMGYHRVNRYEKSTGSPAGFLGGLTATTNINTVATNFTINSLTTTNGCLSLTGLPKGAPGWCIGNTVGAAVTVATGTGNGQFNSPRGIWADDTHVYVADSGNNRVMKFDAVTGAYIGWKGFVTSNAGMSCLSGTATNNNVTPDWCTGGTSGPSKALGAFDSPSGMWGDASYIYVTDTRNNRTVTIPR